MRVNRRGTTLVELMVVLCLGMIVVGLYAGTVVAQRRAERTTAGANAPAAAADEAMRILVTALDRVASVDSLWVRGDTALEWRATIGVAVACAFGADTVVVPDAGSGAWWEFAPDTGDAVAIAAASGAWVRGEVLAVRTRSSGGACGTSQRTLQLRAVPVGITGIPAVRIMRRTRFMLYRGGDGAWWLGQRTCSYALPLHCTSAQPIAGPLAPSPSGVRFVVDSASGVRSITVAVSAGRVARAATVTVRP